MCFFPVMITSSPTSKAGRDMPKSVMASADVTPCLVVKGARVSSGVPSVGGPAAAIGSGGGCFHNCRSACTLSAICRSNAQVSAGVDGPVVTPALEHCVFGLGGEVVSRMANRGMAWLDLIVLESFYR